MARPDTICGCVASAQTVVLVLREVHFGQVGIRRSNCVLALSNRVSNTLRPGEVISIYITGAASVVSPRHAFPGSPGGVSLWLNPLRMLPLHGRQAM